jgi:hypothetical protein
MLVIEPLFGKERQSGWAKKDPEKRKVDGYDDHYEKD